MLLRVIHSSRKREKWFADPNPPDDIVPREKYLELIGSTTGHTDLGTIANQVGEGYYGQDLDWFARTTRQVFRNVITVFGPQSSFYDRERSEEAQKQLDMFSTWYAAQTIKSKKKLAGKKGSTPAAAAAAAAASVYAANDDEQPINYDDSSDDDEQPIDYDIRSGDDDGDDEEEKKSETKTAQQRFKQLQNKITSLEQQVLLQQQQQQQQQQQRDTLSVPKNKRKVTRDDSPSPERKRPRSHSQPSKKHKPSAYAAPAEKVRKLQQAMQDLRERSPLGMEQVLKKARSRTLLNASGNDIDFTKVRREKWLLDLEDTIYKEMDPRQRIRRLESKQRKINQEQADARKAQRDKATQYTAKAAAAAAAPAQTYQEFSDSDDDSD